MCRPSRALITASAILTTFSLTPLPNQALAVESPTETVKQLLEAVRQIKDDKAGPLSSDEVEGNLDMKRRVNTVLDIRGLVERSLGGQWEKLGATDRQAFVDLLTRLLEKVAYPKSAAFFGDLQVQFQGERITGKQAVVRTLVVHPKEGKIQIEYRLAKGSEDWKVWDILLDGASLATNLRTQFQKIIGEEGYPSLVKRMREKLEE